MCARPEEASDGGLDNWQLMFPSLPRRALGGTVSSANAMDPTLQQEEQELAAYDTKVSRAQLQMVKAMSTELKALGVPFFGTHSNLIRKNGEQNLEAVGGRDKVEKERQIDESELIGLQRRMLALLEEMCGSEDE